jgi:hypothetical protein
MSRIDYQPIIANIVQPGIIDNVVNPTMAKLKGLFTENRNFRSGDRITDDNKTAKTSNGGQFTRADANPPTLTQDFGSPWWYKKYFHETAVVRREDVDEAMEGSSMTALMQDAATTATELLMANVFNASWASILADVDDSSNYSDAALTRITVWQSYKDAVDAKITLPTYRAAQHALSLKETINWANYVWMNEQTVWNTGRGLMSETGSWVENNPRNAQEVATGYLPVSSFDGIRVDQDYGMTVGNAFLLNRNDVQWQMHKGFDIEQVPTDEYAVKMVVRIGFNMWVRRPGFQAKLENKD